MVHRSHVAKVTVVASLLAGICLTVFAPTAWAGSPGPGGDSSVPPYVDRSVPSTPQYAQWLALKNAYRIRSGIQPNQPKGTLAHPYVGPVITPSRMPYAGPSPNGIVFPCQEPGATYPCSYELSTNIPVPATWEPSNGGYSNYGTSTTRADDTSSNPPNYHYYSDGNFFFLCGPGAADIVLEYWPSPPNYIDNPGVTDPRTNTTTTWNFKDIDGTYRMRGYLTYLAWQTQAPTWSQKGMMEQYAGVGVTLQTERDALNWEASGKNPNNWQYYFYVVVWWNNATSNDFYNDVHGDLWYSQAALSPEVNAQLMPNWPHNGGRTNHTIAVIGWNDLVHNNDGSYGVYYYTDTCANSTNCGSNTDGGVHTVPYDAMWTAITNIPVNHSTGDGGWVW